ncbi:hypothetical protein HZI73_22715 [Vallitalea pronyensis]|uniref:YvlB/LiaX N-terminal domain-containing protein n=1 Tax=Vallitalea pronyensis TaxID=1348613 RepID=A0A8J8SIT0_9FIRM|nr:hypothetical protein [Vallitalea pronyensis]QUI24926.1 hypothetical protein HZI73_22715 [Vallitalea pronyensis]
MSEERKILDMIEKGQITAEDGMKLLEALRNVEPEVEEVEELETTMESQGSREFKYLKVRVLTEKGDTKVNVNIPMKLVKAVGGVLPHLNNFIPDDVQEDLDEKGINFNKMQLGKIIEALESGVLDDTTLVDIETNDDEDGITQVKVYVE